MTAAWPPNATDEERSLRLFKDALMSYSAASPWSFLSSEAEEAAVHAAENVESAYARVREYAAEDLERCAVYSYAEVSTALRDEERGSVSLPRRSQVRTLAGLDYYFFKLSSGRERVYDKPDLTDEERAAEHGLRHDLLVRLYDELEPAFDVSLSWPPRGFKATRDGELVGLEGELMGMAAVGYDHGYDDRVFYEGHAEDEDYAGGFVEGCLDRIAEGEPDEVSLLRDLWEGGDEWDRNVVLRMLKDESEVREGRFDGRPEFPA